MTVRIMNAALLLLCCLGLTNAWVGISPSIIGRRPMARSIPNCGRRQTRDVVLPPCSVPAALVDVMDRTNHTDVVESAHHDNNNNNNNIENINATTHTEEPIILLESSSHSSSSIVEVGSAADADALDSEDLHPKEEVYTYEQKFTNLVVLCLAFGYALYTILSIDGGMTRGWSASEIAMRIPLDNWGAYESYLQNKPILTKSLINVIIYLLGDWLSQTAFTKTNNLLEFDLQRTLRNGFIGLCFGPLVHEYYQFSDAILPPENGLLVRLQKILMDQTLYLTIKCSLYIGAVGLLAGEDRKTVWETIQDKIGGIVITAWKFWPIVHCVTYSVIPAQHRVLWVNSVDLVWNAILSSAAQKGEEEESLEAKDAVVLQQTSSSSSSGSDLGGQTNTTTTGVAWVAT